MKTHLILVFKFLILGIKGVLEGKQHYGFRFIYSTHLEFNTKEGKVIK